MNDAVPAGNFVPPLVLRSDHGGSAMSSSAHRGRILHFLGDPAKLGDKAWEYFEDGLLWIEHGHVRALDHAAYLLPQLPADLPLEEHPQRLLLPGFVDCHVHYPQLGVIASYGTQLLDWLETHTFPAEQRFADAGYAAAQAELFLDELLRHGTTTALVFGTVHAVSAEAFFQAAQKRRLRMIAGKVLMDRNAPPALCDTAASGYAESRALIERWHGNGRLQYAVTPRFAPTSSPEQLAAAARLLDEYPGVYLHTHLSENLKEVAWVGELFPQAQDYLDVYHRAGLVGERSVFAHGIHLSERECRCLAHKNAALAHCPSSNLFIGSGLFDLGRAQQYGIRVGIGSDVGGGTSLSLLANLADAYKIQQLRGTSLDPFQALYLATLGGARALDLDGLVGNFLPGREADFVALDLAATPMIAQRMEHARGLADTLFVLNTLGDDRAVAETWGMGERRHAKG
ncbi:guanine deaminase [Pseudomonas aeruginosa]